MNKLSICKDWRKIDKLFMVYPSMRPSLLSEFYGLIKCIAETIQYSLELILIIDSEESKSNFELSIGAFENSSLLMSHLTINYWFIDTNDIWCRDYNPISIIEDNQINLIKALYDPSYGFNTSVDNNTGMKVVEHYLPNNNLIPKLLPFKLDGGNVISNEDYVFISEKLFSENWNSTAKELINYFDKYFNTKLITIQVEPLDVIGHTDSLLRFLDDKTILLPSYPDDCRIENRNVNEIYAKIIKELPIDYQYIFLPCEISEEINDEEGVLSAAGNFLNYLRIGNNLYFPSFTGMDKEQKEIKRILRQYNKKLNIYFCKADLIARDGGVFNCITSAIYKID